MSLLKKAELIEGVVDMAAAFRFRSHGKPHAQLLGWLFSYQVATLGIELADNTTVRPEHAAFVQTRREII